MRDIVFFGPPLVGKALRLRLLGEKFAGDFDAREIGERYAPSILSRVTLFTQSCTIATISGVPWNEEYWLTVLQRADAINFIVDPQRSMRAVMRHYRQLLTDWAPRNAFIVAEVSKWDLTRKRSFREA